MSAFGYGTFKQDLLDQIGYISEEYKLSGTETISECLAVMSYLSDNLLSHDKVLKQLKEEAKVEAKRELISKMSS